MSEELKFPNKFIGQRFEKYMNGHEIKTIITSLGNAINERYKNQELVVVNLLKSSFMFSADLIREFRDIYVNIDFVIIDSISQGHERELMHVFTKDISTNVRGKHILIVADIIGKGKKVSFLQKRLALSRPLSISTVAFIDKKEKRQSEVLIDFVGQNIGDFFLVGHGLDVEGYCRNLEDIYFLKYPN